ncbi:MAG: leucine-rich repeat domain-containing protein [Promethearchaeota archaeon]|jgi:Leucine-rich repeat (LRR) protein
MPLTPNAIYQDFVNNDLDKVSAIELLITLIENAESAETRIESIDILHKLQVDDNKTFKFLEHLFISDLNEQVRYLTCKLLSNNFLERSLDTMIWALDHEKSFRCLKSIIFSIGEVNTEKSKTILNNKLKKLSKKEHSSMLKDRFKKKKIVDISNRELAEILINHYLISFLKKTFGYFKYINNGYGLITELDLSNVERYSSSSNKLENFLDSIFSLKFLKKCDLRFNHLNKIPEISNSSLETLDLSYNKLIKLPGISKFSSLKILNLKSNRLRSISDSIGTLSSLENLNLRNNILSSLPDSISSLSSLKSLDLHGNKFSSLDLSLSKSIQELELGWNNFKTVPNGIKSLSSLKKLGLGGNKLINLPDWIGSFPVLVVLDLYDNKIAEIPNSIGALKSLEMLNLRNNELRNLPSNMSNLRILKILNLSWNNLASLPKWIGSFPNLEELNLWGNQLRSLPESIATLSSLKILDLNFNKIEELPLFLRELEKKRQLIIKL